MLNTMIKSIIMGSSIAALSAIGIQTASAEDSEDSIDVITVTATKRAMSKRDVPLSLEVFTGEDLKDIGAVNFDDYALRVPGVGFSSDGPVSYRGSGPSINIRGLGGVGGAGSTTTALYLDETPVPTINIKLVDVNRVEILKGPQGTLYGGRGFGGLVKVVTNRPDPSEFSGEASASISFTDDGGFNHQEELILNVPLIADKLAIRGAAYVVRNDGFVDQIPATDISGTVDQSLTRKNVNKEKTQGARVSLLFQPVDSFRADLSFIYEDQSLDSLSLVDEFLVDTLGVFGTLSPILEPVENDIFNYNATLTYNASHFDVISSTSYFRQDASTTEERSFTRNLFIRQFTTPSVVESLFLAPLIAAGELPPGTTVVSPANTTHFPTGAFNTTDIETDVFAQEVRVVSAHDGPFQWMVGGFYEDRESDTLFFGPSPGAIAAGTVTLDAPGLGLIPFATITEEVAINRRSTASYGELAAFSELTYSFADDLALTVGARYFDTEVTSGSEDLSTSIFAPVIGPATFSEASSNGITPKLLLSHHVTDNALLYAQAVKGFRSGGFSNASTATPTPACQAELAALGIRSDGLVEFESDDLWTYELGAKTSSMDGRLILDGVAFYNDWNNLQQNIAIPVCGIGVVQNSGASRSVGFEGTMTARLTESLVLGVAYGYLDSKITESESGSRLPEGTPFTLAPEHSLATSLSYSAPLPGRLRGMEGFARIDYQYQSKTIFNFLDNFTSPQPSFDSINLRAGVIRDNWEITLFADNVTNERALLADLTAISLGGASRVVGTTSRYVRIMRPRTIGLSVRMHF